MTAVEAERTDLLDTTVEEESPGVWDAADDAPGRGVDARLVLLVVAAECLGVLAGLLSGTGSLLIIVAGIVVPSVLIATVVRPDLGLLALVSMLYTRFSDVMVHEHGAPSTLQPFLLLLVAALGMRVLWYRQIPSGLLRPALALGSYGLVLSLSLFYARDFEIATEAVSGYVKDVLIVLVVIALLRSAQRLHQVVWVLLLSGLLLGMLGVLQYATGSFEQQFGGFAQASVKNIAEGADNYRISGPIADPNHYAQTLLVLFPLALGRLQRSRHALPKLVAAACLVVLLLSILFTFSRGALVALAVVVLVALVRRPPPVWTLVAGAVLVAMLLPFLPAGYVDRFAQLTSTVANLGSERTGEASLSGRLSALQAGSRMFADNPVVGVGPNQFTQHYREYSLGLGIDVTEGGVEPHNLYVQVAAETGWLGLVTLGAVIGLAVHGLRRGRARLREAGLTDDVALVEDLQLALFAYLMAGMFVHNAYPRFLWLLVGVCLAVPQIVTNRLEQHSARERPGPTVLPSSRPRWTALVR